MTDSPPIKALDKICKSVERMAQDAEEGHPPEGYDLRIVARQIGAQIEMMDLGLVGGADGAGA